MKLPSRYFFTVLIFLLTACATQPNAQSEYNGSVITEAELQQVASMTVYDAIRKLRGNMLSYRGQTSLRNTSSPEPTVFLDDQMFGVISTLKQISASQIAEVRLYRAWEATTKFGTGHMGGVIALRSRN